MLGAPAPVAPDDVSGPLAYAYRELTPQLMRNHIDVFERYGIAPDGSAGIPAIRIALDSMERLAAMLQAGNSPVVPDGWVMVPVEPTVEMRKAFHKANDEADSFVSPDHQWDAMLAAAQQQEAE